MTEHEPTTTPLEANTPHLTLEQLPATDDPILLERWQEGLREWRDAFVAYASLGRPELHTPDVLAHFEQAHFTSAESIETLVEDHLRTFGWTDALHRFKRAQSIGDDWLRWDYDAIVRELQKLLDVVESGGRIHAFAK